MKKRMKCFKKAPAIGLSLSATLFGFSSLQAQEAVNEDSVYELSPFEINSNEDSGYLVTDTLAGTRIRTSLNDTPASLSVISAQFMEDTGATDTESLLTYTVATETGGLTGNYAGVGGAQGGGENATLRAPHQNTRIRGLTAADNTRNFFKTDIPWDSYNVDRVDIQRGPNSMLFGVGSPSGIINTSTVPASYQKDIKVEFKFDDEGSTRGVLDANIPLIEDTLAVRVIGLTEENEYQQEPAFEDDDRFYGAIRFEPDLFGEEHSRLSIRASYENGDIDANRPRSLPPFDFITPWFDEDNLNQDVYDPIYAWEFGQQMDRGSEATGFATYNAVPGLRSAIPSADGYNPAFFINNGGETTAIQQIEPVSGAINGYPFARMVIPAGYNQYAKNSNAYALANGLPETHPGANKDFYKDAVLQDDDIFDFYDNLIDGNNKREWSDWDAYNVSLSQSFFDNRFGFELAYDYQELTRGQEGAFLSAEPYIALDVNTHYAVGENLNYYGPKREDGSGPDPDSLTGGNPNPNVGRAFTVASGMSGNIEEEIERTNYRATAFVDIRANDFFDEDSLIAKILGHHMITGLYSEDEKKLRSREWSLFATDLEYSEITGAGSKIQHRDRAVNGFIYLSDDLRGQEANDLNLSRVKTYFNPSGSYNMSFIDPTRLSNGVSDDDPWIRPHDNEPVTQYQNPDNYVGWTNKDINILNSREGDIDQLYRMTSKEVEDIQSEGITWQGYLFDGLIVPTIGWRKDTIEFTASNADTEHLLDPISGVSPDDFKLEKRSSAQEIDGQTYNQTYFEETNETTSWGIVGHTPRFIADMLPANTTISAFYNESENIETSIRFGYDGTQLPNAEGDTKDYGFQINTLDDRLSMKVTWFETKVDYATLDNALGDNAWYLVNQTAFGTAAALIYEAYRNEDDDAIKGSAKNAGMGWFTNWAWPDDGYVYDSNVFPEGYNHASLVQQDAAVKDWYANLPSQEWFDAYGLPIDVAAAQSDDWEVRKGAVTDPTWTYDKGIGYLQPAGGGKINGQTPVATSTQKSKGVEIEIFARPTDNWDFTLNVAKTKSYTKSIGSEFVDLLLYHQERYAGLSGQLFRQWWAGDLPVNQFYDDLIMSKLEFNQDLVGQSAAEVAPWRVNLVTNYRFTEGKLKGLSIGAGYRWQDDLILGYELDEESVLAGNAKLDTGKEIKGGGEDHYDMWIGYTRMITDSIEWKIQLNVKNIDEKDHLVPVTVNPDGEVATARIAEGTSWFVTNTFNF